MSSKLILEAIARQTCFTATYNKVSLKLAPHILYTRHGELYVDAVTMVRDGRVPAEAKIGAFKLTGLTDLALVEAHFRPQSVFDPAQEKYEGKTIFAIESA